VRSIAATILVASAAILAACTNSNAPVTPVASQAKIGHVIVLFQENRSFNNLFAGFPGASTAMSGPCSRGPLPSPVPSGYSSIATWCTPGVNVPLHRITLETTGVPLGGTDIGHDHASFLLEYDGGKMDGFDLIRLGTGGTGAYARLYPYAYVERSEVKPYWDLASTYALGDHMFSTATTDSFVAHQQIIAGTTRLNAHESLVDTPLTNFPWGCDSPPGEATRIITTAEKVLPNGPFPCLTSYATMADVLDASNVSWKYYVYSLDTTSSNGDWSGMVWNGFDAIAKVRCAKFRAPANCSGYGADWKAHVTEPSPKILTDIAGGKLPQVSWVIPGLRCSDHPASGAKEGPSWIAEVVNAVGKSKYWHDTAIVILWDDWGGFYDNVAPPQITYTSLGMRVPLIVVSPFAKRGYVSHTQYDFGSVLKFIEQTFGTGSLNASDAPAASIADTLDLAQKPASFKPVAAPNPHPQCRAGATEEEAPRLRSLSAGSLLRERYEASWAGRPAISQSHADTPH